MFWIIASDGRGGPKSAFSGDQGDQAIARMCRFACLCSSWSAYADFNVDRRHVIVPTRRCHFLDHVATGASDASDGRGGPKNAFSGDQEIVRMCRFACFCSNWSACADFNVDRQHELVTTRGAYDGIGCPKNEVIRDRATSGDLLAVKQDNVQYTCSAICWITYVCSIWIACTDFKVERQHGES